MSELQGVGERDFGQMRKRVIFGGQHHQPVFPVGMDVHSVCNFRLQTDPEIGGAFNDGSYDSGEWALLELDQDGRVARDETTQVLRQILADGCDAAVDADGFPDARCKPTRASNISASLA